jgi:putative ABC transporter-associated repeat protein
MSRTSRRRWTTIGALVGVVVLFAGPTVPLHAQPAPSDDPALRQQIDEDQPVGSERVVLADGHVDLGPAYVDGEWRFMVHDDSTDPSVWRDPRDAVLRIGDAALVEVPDDPTYDFLGAPAGQPVHVVSQTQQPGVVWVGWNTQHPQVMERIDRGVTMTMLGVDGPGRLSVYLQSGDFGPPEVLWSSAEPDPQPIWVDVNTHTHANWVFTEPGVYLVRVEVSAELPGGRTERALADLRFAVGDRTDPSVASAAVPSAGLAAVTGSDLDRVDAADAAAPAEVEPTQAVGSTGVLAAAGLLAVVVAAAVTFSVLRSRRVRAEADRRSAAPS